MKKTIALLLCLALLLSCLAACGQKETPAGDEAPAAGDTEEAAESPAEDAAPAGESGEHLPLVKDGEEVTITIGLQQHAQVEDYDTNYLTRYIEEKTGVNLEFVYFSSDIDEALTQLALMVSGNEKLPDILWSFMYMDKSVMYEYGEDGYFLDLTDYFEDYGYYF